MLIKNMILKFKKQKNNHTSLGSYEFEHKQVFDNNKGLDRFTFVKTLNKKGVRQMF